MAVIFNSGVEAANRTTGVVAGNLDYTCCFYVRFTSTPGPVPDGQTAFVTVNGTGTYTQYAGLYRYDDTMLYLIVDNGSGPSNTSGFAMTEDVWYRVAYTRTGTSNRFYVNGALVGSAIIEDMSATSLSEVMIGSDTFGSSGVDIAYFREWSNDLSLGELDKEFYSTVPVRTSNLKTDYPLTADLNDDSGNGFNLAAIGSITFDAAAPTFPANAIRANAEVIASLPFTDTQDVFSDGFAFEVWYKYTAVADDDVISVWGYGDGLTPFQVRPRVYVGAGLTDILLSGSDSAINLNKPTRFSVYDGEDYFFSFTPSPPSESLGAALLNIQAESFTQQNAPIGSIVINDDIEHTNFPLTLISSTDGDDYNTLHFVNEMAVGEGGDVLTNGIFLLSDINDDELRLYNGDMSLITTLPYDMQTRRSLRTCHGLNVFYFATGAPCILRTCDATGAEGPDTWTIPTAIFGMAANNDGTILYYSTTSPQPVKRWDLTNDIALSDFVPTLTGYEVIDILVLADDTILVSYQVTGGSSGDFKVKRFNAAATVLNTFEFGTQAIFGGTESRMAYAIDNPDSFWVYLHLVAPDNGISVFKNIRISDGVVLSEVESVEFNQGLYIADETLTPVSLFGHSTSCPFFISRVALTVSGTGTLIVQKMTIPSGSIQTFDVAVGGGLTPADLAMQDGDEETYIDVPAGDGYSVVEDVPDGWSVGYNVSNSTPNTNITVPADGEVTVIIVNQFGGGGIFTVPTLPVTPTGPFPPLVNPPKSNDDFPSGGEVVQVKIPNPFFVTGGVTD